MRALWRSWLVLTLCIGGPAGSQTLVDDAALTSGGNGENWVGFGRTYSEQRFSPLTQVNSKTVKELGLAWHLDLEDDRTLTATPLAIDGVLYFTSSYSKTRAVEARTGKLLWEYDPKSIEHAGDRLQNMWDTSRGLAYWKGKVIIATIDGRLVALNAKTGEHLWETLTVDPAKALYITGLPKVFKGKVIVGNGGSEHTDARGYVTAYDVETGKQLWRFYVVPGNPADGFENKAMEMAAKTWTGDWWRFGGGGQVWHGITYDPEFDQVIIGTGNGTPWNRKIRSPGGGDNLFLCSLVALDAETGDYKWHYQTTPGETWDYNSNMDIVLADLKIGGKPVKALMHAPKNGFFYVIDRKDGKLLSAEKIGKVTWATHIDMETGRPVENPKARYEDGEELVWPSTLGAHNWHAMSYNPQTGLAYIPTIEMPGLFSDAGIDLKAWRSKNFRMHFGVTFEGDAPEDWGSAALLAWDPIEQKKAWSVKLPPSWNPGTLTTAGELVFQGQADGDFVAYNASTGAELWSVNLGLGISAPPITYSVDGEQYVSLLVGWGGGGLLFGTHAAQHGWAYRAQPRRLFTFKIGGSAAMPEFAPKVFAKPVDVPDFVIDDALVETGTQVWTESCLWCHGSAAVSGGHAPDLRESPLALNLESFRAIVKNGVLERGMPRFKDHTDEEITALFHFVRREARKAVTKTAKNP